MIRKVSVILAMVVAVSVGMISTQGAGASEPIIIGVPTSTGFLE